MARIGLKKWAENEGIKLGLNPTTGKVRISDSPELLEVLERAILDGMCPCLCDECDEVEPDGHCAHGCPSLLLACGMV